MITNKTKGTIIADEVILCDTPLKRMKGLLGRRGLPKGQAMIIKPCNSVHTFFMHFSIDVLFVNKDNHVLKVLSDIPPFKLTPIYLKSSYVIELPSGAAKASSTEENDQLTIS